MANLNELRNENGTLPAYAWPGGYPVIYFTKDGLTICPKCANREIDSAQAVIAGDVYWEGPTIQCNDCNADLESAYGDPEEKEVR